LRDNWMTDPVMQTTDAKSVGMSHDWFMAILTMLHLNDRENHVARGQPGYDPLFKIQPVLKTSPRNFKLYIHQTNFWQ
jgi:hypothetical protein